MRRVLRRRLLDEQIVQSLIPDAFQELKGPERRQEDLMSVTVAHERPENTVDKQTSEADARDEVNHTDISELERRPGISQIGIQRTPDQVTGDDHRKHRDDHEPVPDTYRSFPDVNRTLIAITQVYFVSNLINFHEVPPYSDSTFVISLPSGSKR